MHIEDQSLHYMLMQIIYFPAGKTVQLGYGQEIIENFWFNSQVIIYIYLKFNNITFII